MAEGSSPEDESLVDLLNRATNPSNREDDLPAVEAFVQKIKKDKDGPQMSVRLLAHKMQVRVSASPLVRVWCLCGGKLCSIAIWIQGNNLVDSLLYPVAPGAGSPPRFDGPRHVRAKMRREVPSRNRQIPLSKRNDQNSITQISRESHHRKCKAKNIEVTTDS